MISHDVHVVFMFPCHDSWHPMNSDACAQHFTADMWNRTARVPRRANISSSCSGDPKKETLLQTATEIERMPQLWYCIWAFVPCVGTGMLTSFEKRCRWLDVRECWLILNSHILIHYAGWFWLLQSYDWKLPDGGRPQLFVVGYNL